MLARTQLFIVAMAVAAPSSVNAADLGAGGSFSEIFAPATPIVKAKRHRAKDDEIVVAPWVNNSPRVPGYYGRAGDFYYSSYYGTSPLVIWGRLPYACKFYASC